MARGAGGPVRRDRFQWAFLVGGSCSPARRRPRLDVDPCGSRRRIGPADGPAEPHTGRDVRAGGSHPSPSPFTRLRRRPPPLHRIPLDLGHDLPQQRQHRPAARAHPAGAGGVQPGRAAPHKLPDRELFAMLAETRRKIAQLIGAAAEEIALTVNTGFGISMAARALPLEPGDIVLVSDKEFPANVYPWLRLKDRGVTMELVPTTRGGLARRGAAAGAAPRSAGAGPRRVAGAVQQRLPGGSRPALRRDAGDRRVPGGGRDPGHRTAAGGSLAHPGGRAGLRRAEVAALALGLGLRLRPPRSDRDARPRDHRLALVRGHRRSHPAHPVRRHAAGRRPPLRADDASVPGLRRAQRLAGAAALARRSSGSAITSARCTSR